MKLHFKKPEGWEEFLELGVASWLVISPFVLGFLDSVSATLSAMFAGCVMILFSLLGMATQRPWDEWTNILVAVILIASPWFAGYTALNIAVGNALVSGVVLIVLASVALLDEYREIRENNLRPHT